MGDTAEGMHHELLHDELSSDMTGDALDAAETEQELDTALHEAIDELDDEVQSTLVSLQDEIQDWYVEYITRLMVERPILFDGEDNNYLAAYILWDHGDIAWAIAHLYHSAYEDRESSADYTRDIIRAWIDTYDTTGQYADRTDEKIHAAMPTEPPHVGTYGYEDDAANIPSGLDVVLEQLKDIAVSEMQVADEEVSTIETVWPSDSRERSHQMVPDIAMHNRLTDLCLLVDEAV